MMNLFKIFKKPSVKTAKGESLKEILKKRYVAFQSLLSENNNVLTLMADMEEKLSGEYLFDRHYVVTRAREIVSRVLRIIDYLNAISNNGYGHLRRIHAQISSEIELALARRREIVKSDLVIPVEKLTGDMTDIAGGKIAHLGEIRGRLSFPTPDGFSITAYAFKRFLEHNNLTEKINERLAKVDIKNMEGLADISRNIQDMVMTAELPEDMQNAVKAEMHNLRIKNQGSPLMVSVRSSAICEDGEFSFAGQYATFLNVPEHLILQKYKEVVASLFTQRAIFYYKTKGFSEEDMVMAVGVLNMIDAKVGGVMYTKDPNDPGKETVIINALWGLGKAVVDGMENPNSCSVSKVTNSILEKRAGIQNTMIVSSPEGDIREIGLPDEMKGVPCLTDAQIMALSRLAVLLEKHYSKPQDIEWAIDRNDRIYILQSRSLAVSKREGAESSVPRRIEGREILLDRGVIACKGIGAGRAFVLKEEEDLKDFPEGAVLIARHTSTRFVTIMNKASAIIADVGGAAGHMASLSREYGVPTILDAETATRAITHGQEITVDAVNCTVYQGLVPELMEHAAKKELAFKDTRLFTTLERVLKLIVPLNLVDPDRDNFTPEHCSTLHDITRFVHEMAMAEIFKTGKGQSMDSLEDLLSAAAFAEAGEAKRLGEQTSALRAGIPVDAQLLNIDGGIRGELKKVTAADITSIPFSAFLKGMMGMKWPEPRPADIKGFLGMIAHTASIPEEQLQKIGQKSYAIVSREYMNFSIRLGYHFSMVEAYVSENLNDNYIKFFFKGGGAVVDRRLRRVRLIREILKALDFKVSVTEDVIDAMLAKYRQPDLERVLEAMGKLTAYTKQLDMVMYNDAVTDMFIEEFVKQHIPSST